MKLTPLETAAVLSSKLNQNVLTGAGARNQKYFSSGHHRQNESLSQ